MMEKVTFETNQEAINDQEVVTVTIDCKNEDTLPLKGCALAAVTIKDDMKGGITADICVIGNLSVARSVTMIRALHQVQDQLVKQISSSFGVEGLAAILGLSMEDAEEWENTTKQDIPTEESK